ncbi:MAG: PAS domain S-box protein, partial [Candidatus Marinimicrobia bacterium]|nr:PAS domain S-box protein [Candidatus Neomarinimicrobiota bacterium]
PDGVQVGIGIDITRRKKDEIQMQKHLEENQFLAETSIALSKTKNIDEVCRLVGQKTHDLDSSSYVILSTYNEECEGIRIHCIVGLNDKMSQVSELLGQKPSDLVFEPDKIRPERIQDYHSGKLIQIKDGLYELLGRRIDKSRCRKVEKYLNVNEVWHIGFTVDDMPYGTLTIMVKTGAEIHFPKAIETLMGTAAAVIKRFIAEKALKQSEKRFRSLYENATIGFYRTTPDGQILMANPALVQMLGFDSLADLQKRNLQENGYEPDYPRAEFLKTIYETGEIVGLESAWKRKTGKWIYVRENAHAVHDEKGAVQFFEGTVENISYERKAEEELQLRAQLLDMASDSIFLHDTEGNFIYFNENAYKTLGYTQEEFAGLKLREIDAPKYIQKIPNRMQRLLEIGHLSFETEHRHKNGAFIPMEVSARIIEIDKKPHVLAAVRNISERKKAEAALRDSETHFRMIAENIQDGITYIEEGAVKYRNDRVCDILGFTQSELKKLRIHELAAPEDADRVNAEFRAKLKSNLKAFNIDFWVIRKDGERRYIDNRYSIPDPAHPQTYYVTSTDQTEWKNAEEERIRLQDQRLQSQKMESIGTLAGGVAHDFNNLLTVIQGHAQLTMMRMTDSDPNYRGLRQIVNASTRAANLTRQLLLFSRKEAMDFKPINLNWTLENLIAMLQRLIGEDIRIDTFLSNDLWQINADEGNLEQVIMNITVNARDAMPRGGKVSIKTENLFLSEAECKIIDESYSGRFVRLSIEDTGTGIPADILDKIFEPFYSTKEVGKGTGLGLSVVYGIIKKHDGWINVYSESGQGTIFKIYLPAITVKVQKTEKKKSGIEDLTGRGECILVIEDEEEVRNFAVAALRQNGYLTIEAENSAAALEVFKKEKGRFDLILSDVILPDKNGFLLVEELLEIRGDIPVIMSSGYTEEKVQQTIIQKQGFRFLQKPYNLQEMLLTVKQVLNPS